MKTDMEGLARTGELIVVKVKVSSWVSDLGECYAGVTDGGQVHRGRSRGGEEDSGLIPYMSSL